MDSNTEKSENNFDVSSSSKKEVPSSLQKVCLVCGDKALGYNFNAISCESCKAFFRRNALTNKEFKCPFSNKCEINVVTRRFCQKCRMVKCLAVGMVKEFIMSEEDKAKKRRKIEENRAKKRRSEPRDLGSQSKSLKREDDISNTSKEDYNSALKESCHNSYRDENTNAYVDSNSNPYTEGASNNTTAAYNTSKSYQDNIRAYKQENTVNSFREDESNMFHVESSTPYREITVKNREDSCFSFRDNTVPYRDDITMLSRDDTSSFKPDSSMSYQKENINKYPTQMTDSAVQFDMLNSTSPSSSVQSPSSNDIDSSVHSSPLYNPYASARSSDIPYPNRGFHVDDNGIVNRAVYRIDSFRVDSENGMYPDRKQISIRSILTNGDIGRPVVCDQTPTPSTSSETDINKAKEILQDVERIEPNSMESILCEAIKLEFEAYTSTFIPCASSRELNEVERAKLNELIVANKALHAPIDQDMSVLIEETPASVGIKEDASGSHDPRLVKIVNLTAVAIRRFIKMVKKINAFRNMCEEDQIALLKGGCIEMLVLRSAMQYDGQRNTWKVPHSQEEYGTIRTDVLKLAKGNIYTKHEAFIRSFDQRWRCDEHIILVMSAILLFTPDRAKVVHRDVIKLEQNSYYYLLRRYLESVYPGCEAKSTFLKLIQKILELRKLAEEVTEVYLDVNPIEPLLMEIFDLKHHAA